MNRVEISRFINHRFLGGQPNEMVSARVYRERRYGWMLCIDWWFYILTGKKRHCHLSYLFERSQDG